MPKEKTEKVTPDITPETSPKELYNFPEYGITVEASCIEDAKKKLKQLLTEKE